MRESATWISWILWLGRHKTEVLNSSHSSVLGVSLLLPLIYCLFLYFCETTRYLFIHFHAYPVACKTTVKEGFLVHIVHCSAMYISYSSSHTWPSTYNRSIHSSFIHSKLATWTACKMLLSASPILSTTCPRWKVRSLSCFTPNLCECLWVCTQLPSNQILPTIPLLF